MAQPMQMLHGSIEALAIVQPQQKSHLHPNGADDVKCQRQTYSARLPEIPKDGTPAARQMKGR